MTKLTLAAIDALRRHMTVPGKVPKRYPDDAVINGTAGMASISARTSGHVKKKPKRGRRI